MNEIVKGEYAGLAEVREQVNSIQHLMKNVLQEGTHYGKIPGTGKDAKPTLLQPGAEKIGFMFHLVPTYSYEERELPNGHREYGFTCTLTQRETGQVMGMGYGLCSTMESKYRYRTRWQGNGQKTREENPDIADVYNTVFKMAKKRAFVDAVKSTTAASDIFTQDVEDMPSYLFDQRPSAAQAPQMPEDRAETLRSLSQRWSSAMGISEADAKRAVMYAVGKGGDVRTIPDAEFEANVREVKASIEAHESGADAEYEVQDA